MAKELIIQNAGKRFGDLWVLRNICARVHPGRITAFVGPNGAGKTTLFHLITGDYVPDEGHISIDGRKITGLPPWKVATLGVGRQFQDVRVFGGLTVLDNVRVALMHSREQSPIQFWRYVFASSPVGGAPAKKANEWLEFAGLQGYSNSLARELSFGEQKLLSLATILASGATILLLDEPTAGLSHGMINRLVRTLEDVVAEKGISIALIEHNMTVVTSLAYWVYFLNEGKVAFTGRSDHVLGNREVREVYMGLS